MFKKNDVVLPDPRLRSELTDFLSRFVSEHKLALMDQVLDQRTRYLTVVMEDLHQSQNTSAIVRTCECLGIQDVHIIEEQARYGTNKKVLKGSHFWVDLIKHKVRHAASGPKAALDELKKKGYRILVTSVDPGSRSIQDVDVSAGKIAVVMGNELRGTSNLAVKLADELVHIPMVGFTESFNVSVSAAIILSQLREKIMAIGDQWKLTEEEKADLRLEWVRVMVKKSDVLEREFLRSRV